MVNITAYFMMTSGADPGFQVREGGGGGLKQIASSGGRRKNCWDTSCEKSRLYAKKLYFFQFKEGGGETPGGEVLAHTTSLTRHILLKYLHQTRKAGGHVFVCYA